MALSVSQHELGRCSPSMEPAHYSTDELARKYADVASDGQNADAEREAAMLFSVAEVKLRENPLAHDECEEAAREALESFRRIGNLDGCTDALRLIIHARRTKAETLLPVYAEQKRVQEILEISSKLAMSEAKYFQDQACRRGEGAMRLGYAELNQDSRTASHELRTKAVEEALNARKLLKEAGDVKLEAQAVYCVCFLQYRLGKIKDAIELADVCIGLCRTAQDKLWEAKGWHLMSILRQCSEQFDDSIEAAKEALALFKDLGDAKQEACENFSIAQCYLFRQLAQVALPYLHEALVIFKSLPNEHVLLARTQMSYVNALLMNGQVKEASRWAEECQQVSRSRNDSNIEARAAAAMSCVSLHLNNTRNALSSAHDACRIARASRDPHLEAEMLKNLAMVQLEMKNYEDAYSAAQDGVSLLQCFSDKHGEAMFMNLVIQIAIEKQDWPEVTQALSEQRALFQQADDKNREGICLITQAGVLSNTNWEQSVELVREALSIFSETGNKRGATRAYRALAILWRERDRLESALEATDKMRETARSLGDKAVEGNATREMAMIQLERDNYLEAVKLACEAQSLCKRSGDKRAECEAWMTITHCQCAAAAENESSPSKNRSKIMRPAQEAMSLAKKLCDKLLIAHAMFHMAQAHSILGNINEASQSANQARAAFHALGDTRNEAMVVLLLGRIQDGHGKEDKALEKYTEVEHMAKTVGDEKLAAQARKLISKSAPASTTAGKWVFQSAGKEEDQELEEMMEYPYSYGASGSEAYGGTSGRARKSLDKKVVHSAVCQVIAKLLGEHNMIDDDATFMDNGLDSLTALSFRQGLQERIGLKFGSSFVYDYPTPGEMVDRIVQMSTRDD